MSARRSPLRYLRHALALVTVASVTVFSAFGCVDTEATFLVRNVSVFDDSCVCDPGSDAFLSGGSVEASLGGTYDVCLVVRNGLDALEDRNKPRAETNFIEIYAVDVTLEGEGLADSDACPTSFTYPSKGFAEPESLGSVIAVALPSCITQAFGGSLERGTSTTVIASFIVHGHTSGGDEVETPEFTFPITVGRNTFCGGAAVSAGEEIPCRAGQDQQAPSNLCN